MYADLLQGVPPGFKGQRVRDFHIIKGDHLARFNRTGDYCLTH